MKFAPGEVLLRRYWRGGRISTLTVARVAADDEHGLRLWVPVGSAYWRITGRDGRTPRDAPIDELAAAELVRYRWTGNDVMIWMPAGEAYSVWWFWGPDGDFSGWYVNLEDPYVRWADRGCAGVDTADHALDLWVKPDRSTHWKDRAEFEARTGHPLYWSAGQAAEIEAAGERARKLARAGAFPFDGTWCGYRSDSSWTLPGRPAGWARPRAVE